MRGKLAKLLRKQATGLSPSGEEVLDKRVYKFLKRQSNTGQFPKLPSRTRWDTSPVRRSKAPTFSGIYYGRYHSLRSIGTYYVDLTEKGKGIALNIARAAGRLSKPDLYSAIKGLKNYVKQPESNES